MAIRRTPTEAKPVARSRRFWLFVSLFIVALFAGFALALDLMDPQHSRLF